MEEVVTADIGGTNARFAIARIEERKVVKIHEPVTLAVRDNPTLLDAWHAFARHTGRRLPRRAVLALPGPVSGEKLTFANSPWVIEPAGLSDLLEVDEHLLINDFGAVTYAVASLPASQLVHLAGPDKALPTEGVTLVIGPGTGLGVAFMLRRNGHLSVCETEGGHIGFSPSDDFEDRLHQRMRNRVGRVSVERMVAGPGLVEFGALLAEEEGVPLASSDPAALWTLALEGRDPIAVKAMARFCGALGGVAGDLALAHGANGVVLAGGVGRRLADDLPGSDFAARFSAKGRFAGRMKDIPIKLVMHPEPGLLGAAAALAVRG